MQIEQLYLTLSIFTDGVMLFISNEFKQIYYHREQFIEVVNFNNS